MDNFDEARNATEQMFDTPAEETPVEQPIEEVPAEQPVETPAPEDKLAEVTNVAQQVTEMAEQQNAELSKAMSENEQLRQQNEQLQRTISEMSQTREEEVIEEAMAMPTIDFNELAFADEDTQRMAQQEYANKMAEFVRKGVMDEMSPFIEQAKAGQREKEKSEAVATLSQMPELAGLNEMMPQIEHIISNNKWLQNDDIPIEEKIISAYAIARGVNAMNTPVEEKKPPTDDELMELYDKNPTFQELIEKKRIESLKNSQQVPPLSASSGAVNVALNIPEKPKSWDDASERTRKMFGG
jgi:regulator of replication initiation timing